VLFQRNINQGSRLILDLSYPEGKSVNDGIELELCSLKYVSVDDAVRVVLELGTGTQLAKLDIQNVYCIIPVHLADRRLLGMSWRGHLYVDSVLPFGLRSAPKVFTAVADALQWIFESKGVTHIMHYLDDFILLGPPASSVCKQAQDMTLEWCSCLGVPIAAHKTEGPTTSQVFLGYLSDVIHQHFFTNISISEGCQVTKVFRQCDFQ